jgi:hypothetical protein
VVLAAGISALPAGAQTVRNLRINLHEVRNQVGIVTQVAGRTAWIKVPNRLAPGAVVEFTPFSNGADVLARGRVQWVSPVAPYEAYVTDVQATKTSHRLNEIDDVFSIAAISSARRDYGPTPDSDPFAVYLSAGFFARTPIEPPRENAAAVEPVRAHIAALRARNNRVALSIAGAAERALTRDPLIKEEGEEDPVNFSALADNLRRFRRLRIEDPITERLLKRLYDFIEHHGAVSEAVPTDFLRPAGETMNPLFGQQGGLTRP